MKSRWLPRLVVAVTCLFIVGCESGMFPAIIDAVASALQSGPPLGHVDSHSMGGVGHGSRSPQSQQVLPFGSNGSSHAQAPSSGGSRGSAPRRRPGSGGSGGSSDPLVSSSGDFGGFDPSGFSGFDPWNGGGSVRNTGESVGRGFRPPSGSTSSAPDFSGAEAPVTGAAPVGLEGDPTVTAPGREETSTAGNLDPAAVEQPQVEQPQVEQPQVEQPQVEQPQVESQPDPPQVDPPAAAESTEST